MFLVNFNGVQLPEESFIATVTDVATGKGYTFYVPVELVDTGTSLTSKIISGAVTALGDAGITATAADILVSSIERGA